MDSTVFAFRHAGLPACRLVLSAVLLALTATAHALSGTVVAVADGDTVAVMSADRQIHRVRLAGIDAPERSQAHGISARARLATLVQGKPVTVESAKNDRYGRIVGVVRLASADCAQPACPTADVGLTLIAEGWAWHYREYAAEQSLTMRTRYASAEADARESGRGLWQDMAPLPPWQYRRTRRAASREQD